LEAGCLLDSPADRCLAWSGWECEFGHAVLFDNRNIPGGPAAYQQEFSNRPFAFAALAGFTIATWLQDVLLVSSLSCVLEMTL
jgi:hypothetical protein